MKLPFSGSGDSMASLARSLPVLMLFLLITSGAVAWAVSVVAALAVFIGGFMISLNVLVLYFVWVFLMPRNLGAWASGVLVVKYSILIFLGYAALRIWQLSVLWLSVGLISQVAALILLGLLGAREKPDSHP
jgi:hypothetical protein